MDICMVEIDTGLGYVNRQLYCMQGYGSFFTNCWSDLLLNILPGLQVLVIPLVNLVS